MGRGSAWPLRALALASVCLLAGLGASRADAQTPDVRAAADQYLGTLIVGAGDARGYRPLSTDTVNPQSIGALAGRSAAFLPEPVGSKPIAGFFIWAYVMPSAEAASREVASIRSGGSIRGDDGSVLTFQWTESLSGFDQAEVANWDWRFSDGTRSTGVGMGWRRGSNYFILLAVQSVLTNRVAWFNEMIEIARIQEAKAARRGAFVPPAPPSPPPAAATSTTTNSQAMPDMLLLVTARVGGAVAREGTVIRAFIDGKECGRASLVFGFTALSVASRDTTAGCGAPGAAVVFRIGDDLAAETVSWGLDNFITPASLNVNRPGGNTGLVVRPVLVVNCISPAGRCSEQEQALWSGNLDAWLDELQQRGIEPSGDSMLRGWIQFRADRGEIFGALARAFLDEQPFTFVMSVRFAPASGDPDSYVSIFNFGADRPVGGWIVRSGNATYTFAPDAVLTKGVCRIYRGAVPATDVNSTCPGAVLEGEDAIGQQGFVEILDAEGQEIDSVAW